MPSPTKNNCDAEKAAKDAAEKREFELSNKENAAILELLSLSKEVQNACNNGNNHSQACIDATAKFTAKSKECDDLHNQVMQALDDLNKAIEAYNKCKNCH